MYPCAIYSIRRVKIGKRRNGTYQNFIQQFVHSCVLPYNYLVNLAEVSLMQLGTIHDQCLHISLRSRKFNGHLYSRTVSSLFFIDFTGLILRYPIHNSTTPSLFICTLYRLKVLAIKTLSHWTRLKREVN